MSQKLLKKLTLCKAQNHICNSRDHPFGSSTPTTQAAPRFEDIFHRHCYFILITCKRFNLAPTHLINDVLLRLSLQHMAQTDRNSGGKKRRWLVLQVAKEPPPIQKQWVVCGVFKSNILNESTRLQNLLPISLQVLFHCIISSACCCINSRLKIVSIKLKYMY